MRKYNVGDMIIFDFEYLGDITLRIVRSLDDTGRPVVQLAPDHKGAVDDIVIRYNLTSLISDLVSV